MTKYKGFARIQTFYFGAKGYSFGAEIKYVVDNIITSAPKCIISETEFVFW